MARATSGRGPKSNPKASGRNDATSGPKRTSNPPGTKASGSKRTSSKGTKASSKHTLTPKVTPNANGAPNSKGARKRGRPQGSDLPTGEALKRMLSYIEAGGSAWKAAQAEGINYRTFNDWMQRGRGDHSTRPATPQLKSFATEIDKAHARSGIGAEIEVRRKNPLAWLRHVDRDRPGRPGWSLTPPLPETEPDPAAQQAQSPPTHVCHEMATPEEAAAALQILWDAGAIGFEDDEDEDEDEEEED